VRVRPNCCNRRRRSLRISAPLRWERRHSAPRAQRPGAAAAPQVRVGARSALNRSYRQPHAHARRDERRRPQEYRVRHHRSHAESSERGHLQLFAEFHRPKRLLTVKVGGRPEAPPKRRGRTLSPGARGAKPQAHHGPLQRLLDRTPNEANLMCTARSSTRRS